VGFGPAAPVRRFIGHLGASLRVGRGPVLASGDVRAGDEVRRAVIGRFEHTQFVRMRRGYDQVRGAGRRRVTMSAVSVGRSWPLRAAPTALVSGGSVGSGLTNSKGRRGPVVSSVFRAVALNECDSLGGSSGAAGVLYLIPVRVSPRRLSARPPWAWVGASGRAGTLRRC